MPVYIDGHYNYIAAASNLPLSTAFTLCGWVYLPADYQYGYLIGVSNSDNSAYYRLYWHTAPNFALSSSTGITLFGPVPANQQWLFFALTCAGTGATDLKGYCVPANSETWLIGQRPGISFTPSVFRVGSRELDIGGKVPGYYAGWKFYNRALNQAELNIERQSYLPLNSNGINRVIPLFNVADVAHDYGPNRYPIAHNGVGVADIEGPPIRRIGRPRRAQVFVLGIPGSGSGLLGDVTASPIIGVSSGAAALNGLLATVTLASMPTAIPTGAVVISGGIAGVSAVVPAGSATGAALIGGILPVVSISPPLPQSSGVATTGGAFPSISTGFPLGSAMGWASISALIRTVTVSVPGASVGGSPAGFLGTVTVLPPEGSAKGAVSLSRALITVTVSPAAGTGLVPSGAAGALTTVTVSAPFAITPGAANAIGALISADYRITFSWIDPTTYLPGEYPLYEVRYRVDGGVERYIFNLASPGGSVVVTAAPGQSVEISARNINQALVSEWSEWITATEIHPPAQSAISVSSPFAVAQGLVSISGALGLVTASASEASATGAVSINASIQTVGFFPPQANVQVGSEASVSGSIPEVTLSVPNAGGRGAASISRTLISIALTPPASGVSVGTPSGALSTITLAVIEGTAREDIAVVASGAVGTIVSTAPEATVTGGVSLSRDIPTATMTAPAGYPGVGVNAIGALISADYRIVFDWIDPTTYLPDESPVYEAKYRVNGGEAIYISNLVSPSGSVVVTAAPGETVEVAVRNINQALSSDWSDWVTATEIHPPAQSAITLASPQAEAVGTVAATGDLVAVTLSSPVSSATGAVTLNASIQTANVSPVQANVSVETLVYASGGVGTLLVSTLNGGATGHALATGALQTVTRSVPLGVATGAVSVDGDIGALDIFAPTAQASASAVVSGTLGPVSVSAPEATALGGTASTAIGSLPVLSVAAPAALGEGNAEAAGQAGSVIASTPDADARGSAQIPSDLIPVNVTRPEAVVSVPSLAGGSTPLIIISPVIGLGTSGGGGGGALSTITLESVSGSVTGSASVSCSLPYFAIIAASGSATGSTSADGTMPVVRCAAPLGYVTGTAVTNGPLPTIASVSLTAQASGAGRGTGGLPTLIVQKPTGQVTVPITVSAGLAQGFVISPAANARGDARIAGDISVVSVASVTGNAVGGSVAMISRPLLSVIVTRSTGNAAGEVSLARPIGQIGLWVPNAVAFEAIPGDLSTVTTIPPAGQASTGVVVPFPRVRVRTVQGRAVAGRERSGRRRDDDPSLFRTMRDRQRYNRS